MINNGTNKVVLQLAIPSAICLLLAAAIGGLAIMFSRNSTGDSADAVTAADQQPTHLSSGNADFFAAAREEMVRWQLRARDIVDPRVLAVMGRVPRERFVPAKVRDEVYEDHPLPIGFHQTISQPYIVALMTQLARPVAEPRPGGWPRLGLSDGHSGRTVQGSLRHRNRRAAGRQRPESARRAGIQNATIRSGDGYRGWPEHAPFDVILVTAAPDHVPEPLVEQLAPGGRLVIPVGRGVQELLLIEKRPDGSIHRDGIAPVQFVPMTGEAEHHSR